MRGIRCDIGDARETDDESMIQSESVVQVIASVVKRSSRMMVGRLELHEGAVARRGRRCRRVARAYDGRALASAHHLREERVFPAAREHYNLKATRLLLYVPGPLVLEVKRRV